MDEEMENLKEENQGLKTREPPQSPALSEGQKKEISERENRKKIAFEKLFAERKAQLFFFNESEITAEFNLKSPVAADGKTFDSVLKDVMGSIDSELAMFIFNRGKNSLTVDDEVQACSIAIESLAAESPKDVTEARLVLQKNSLFSMGMKYLERSECHNMTPQKEFCMKNAIKLLRLHNETVEALSRYRRGGEQKVLVQHVNISDGSQGIINNGSMTTGGGGKHKNDEVPHG